MKFDRTSPLAWAYFLVTAANIVIASVVAAALPRPDGPRRGVLSGHLYNGNLRVFYDTVGAKATDWVFRYIYIDHGAYLRARSDHPEALSSVRIDHMIWMARADAVMTDHLPGIWALLQVLRPGIAFVDVWHGVGFKALGPELGQKTGRCSWPRIGMLASRIWPTGERLPTRPWSLGTQGPTHWSARQIVRPSHVDMTCRRDGTACFSWPRHGITGIRAGRFPSSGSISTTSSGVSTAGRRRRIGRCCSGHT